MTASTIWHLHAIRETIANSNAPLGTEDYVVGIIQKVDSDRNELASPNNLKNIRMILIPRGKNDESILDTYDRLRKLVGSEFYINMYISNANEEDYEIKRHEDNRHPALIQLKAKFINYAESGHEIPVHRVTDMTLAHDYGIDFSFEAAKEDVFEYQILPVKDCDLVTV